MKVDKVAGASSLCCVLCIQVNGTEGWGDISVLSVKGDEKEGEGQGVHLSCFRVQSLWE